MVAGRGEVAPSQRGVSEAHLKRAIGRRGRLLEEHDRARVVALALTGEAEARELGFTTGQFLALIGLGEVALAEGSPEDAADRYGGAMALQRRGGPVASGRIIAGIAKLAITAGETVEAARLLGAASSVADSVGLATPLVYEGAGEQCTQALQQSLGEEAFQAAWQEGRAWASEEALERGRRHLLSWGAIPADGL